jgi:L-aminopeptidase/D-esterase-like protein
VLHPGAITDVAGLAVGHWSDARRPTGCSVVLCPQGATCGVDVRGAAPGTRETELLNPVNTVPVVHAVLLAGGSAFGLDAAGGVMRWLEERGHGFEVGPVHRDGPAGRPVRVPIVPAAILFDLWVGDASIRPGPEGGYAACAAAGTAAPPQGTVGAGTGATVGKMFGIERAMKGGIGTASVRAAGITVGALIAVNAFYDVVDPATGRPLAGVRTADGRALRGAMAALLAGELPPRMQAGSATTIGVVATDARLDKAQATKVAQMAHAGLARAIDPVHSSTDGDALFALATGAAGRPADTTLVGALAAVATARAVVNAVRAAASIRTADGLWIPSLHDLPPFPPSAA